MDNTHLPTEEEQFEAYKEAVETMEGKTVIIRTLDIGGDKDIPYMDFEKEENPFLGFRAVRYCLANTDMYKTQLRAIVRASAYGKAKIMVPLVTTVEEVRTVKKLVAEIKEDLRKEGIPFDEGIEVGCMTETAASAAIADLLAKEADFFSIGTNDLTGYTMAVDRGNAKVAYLYSAFQPAVLRSIRQIISAAKEAGIPVGMCGQAAAVVEAADDAADADAAAVEAAELLAAADAVEALAVDVVALDPLDCAQPASANPRQPANASAATPATNFV
jgi:phosphotransferase system enzyme I (PtsI)